MGVILILWDLPSGKRSHSYGTSPFIIGKSTINECAIFSSYVRLTEGEDDFPAVNCMRKLKMLFVCGVTISFATA